MHQNFRRLIGFTGIGLLLSCAQPLPDRPNASQSGPIVLARQVGPPIVVHTSGAGASPTAAALARQILETERRRGEQCAASANDAANCSQNNVFFTEAKAAAIDQLEDGLLVMTRTSGGALPESTVSTVSALLEAINKAASKPSTLRDRVRIVAHPETLALFAVEYIEYTKRPTECRSDGAWSSYTASQALSIRTYQFRFTRLDNQRVCCTPVAVFDDPTAISACLRPGG